MCKFEIRLGQTLIKLFCILDQHKSTIHVRAERLQLKLMRPILGFPAGIGTFLVVVATYILYLSMGGISTKSHTVRKIKYIGAFTQLIRKCESEGRADRLRRFLSTKMYSGHISLIHPSFSHFSGQLSRYFTSITTLKIVF